ncbi:MAG TPA: tetratricopeptide repeat protein, partial [Xanthobacteraceae bacterium]|nr:tetratricopeptide repeat protein [Xanthobacteraceae bacterium]
RARAVKFHTYIARIKGERFTIDPQCYLEHEPVISQDIEWLNQTIGEKVFDRADPKPASVPRWSQSTTDSIKDLVAGMASRLKKLEKNQYPPKVERPSLPAELEWLRDVYYHGTSAATEGEPMSPQFDQATVRSLGCFLHAVALAIQHMKANQFTHRKRFTIWKSPREAEDHYRELVRRNPSNAAAQYRLSQAHLLRGHLSAARKAAETAAALAPDRAHFRLWLRLVNAAARLMLRPRSHQPQA